jgi:hypothetical protein
MKEKFMNKCQTEFKGNFKVSKNVEEKCEGRPAQYEV